MNRKTVVLGVTVALAVTGAVAAWQAFRTSNRAEFNAACAYADCGWLGTAEVQIGRPYPPVCPNCGRQSVGHLATCKKCGNQQILNEELIRLRPDRKELSPQTACVKCGGPIRHGD